jgi:phosphinothricin acetyltransferase
VQGFASGTKKRRWGRQFHANLTLTSCVNQAMEPIIRPSKAADVAAIAEIYGFHVLNGLASFELLAPSADEIAKRRADVVGKNFPYLAAEVDGRVVGYAYASPYRARPAYRHTLENSVYVHKDYVGRGIGKLLLNALIEGCEKAGCRQLVAVIGDSDNVGSIRLHAACGFQEVGVLKAVGFKFGRWVDSVYMQRAIGEGAVTVAPDRDTSSGKG